LQTETLDGPRFGGVFVSAGRRQEIFVTPLIADFVPRKSAHA